MEPLALIGWSAATVYALAMIGLACYGVHSLYLMLVHRRYAADSSVCRTHAPAPPERSDLPTVLVQVPVFNERDVVARAVAAVGALDWPRDRLRIQLLDDSTDDSVELGAAAVAGLRARGIDAVHLHRDDRRGFKAGALAAGMARDDAPFIAIFDADFVPDPDFLTRAIVPLLEDARLALVQGRWAHLNREESMLTRAQAIGIDGHFAVEQGARASGGLFMNFNGTCGLWRRAAIEDAGGWQHDTLTEDLDLSYRAQLAGWRCTYRATVAVPGELPGSVAAWRSQQFRWAKGSMQTARKLLPHVWRAARPLHHKLAATMHLTHYAVHPLMLTSLIAAPIALWLCPRPPVMVLMAGLLAFLIGVASPIALYTYGQVQLHGRRGWRTLRTLPGLAAVGTGIAISNSRAVFQAWRGVGSDFVRTPKRGRGAGSYRPQPGTGIPELLAALWAGVGILLCADSGRPWLLPLLVLYASGFAWVGWRLAWPNLCAAWHTHRELDRPRQVVALGLLGILLAAGYLLLGTTDQDWREAPALYGGIGLALGFGYVVAACLVRREPGGSRCFAVILVAGLLFRIAALGIAPSDDLNRYVAEGRQLAYAQNPYAVAPAEPEAQALLADRLDPQIQQAVNHADWTAIYPPLAIGVHMVVTHADSRITSMRVFYALCEIAAMLLALALLRAAALPAHWWLVAWWNPIGPLWFAGEGHNDALMVALLLGGLLLACRSRATAAAVCAVSLAALVKPFAALALPVVLRGAPLRRWLLPPAIALLTYLPFAGAGMGLFHSLGRFGGELHYHGVLEPPIRAWWALVASPELVRPLTVGTLLGLLALGGTLLMRGRDDNTRDLLDRVARLLLLMLVCLPTVHPWYLLIVVGLLPVMHRARGLLLWSAIMPAYWLHGLAMLNNRGMWTEDQALTLAAHLPILVLVLADLLPPGWWSRPLRTLRLPGARGNRRLQTS